MAKKRHRCSHPPLRVRWAAPGRRPRLPKRIQSGVGGAHGADHGDVTERKSYLSPVCYETHGVWVTAPSRSIYSKCSP